MIRNRIRLYSYHTFLVIPFIVLFLYARNQNQAGISMTYRTLAIGMLVTTGLFAAVYMLLKSRLKTGVYVTVLLFGLFQYGVVYELFEKLYYQGKWPFQNIHRYMIFFYLMLFGSFLWLMKRSKHDFIKINYFLNILMCLLIVFNLFKLDRSLLTGASDKDEQKGRSSGIVFESDKPRPDLYYIILDGYASDKVLNKYYGFNNSEFRNDLAQLGFKFRDSATSNYYYTSQSLSATFNMGYIDDHAEVNSALQNNLLFDVLKENSYRIYHLYSGYAVTSSFGKADSTIGIEAPNEFEKSILRHTVLRLDDLVGIFAYRRLNSQFSKMYELSELSHQPKFCFMHFVAPHPPYVFDREGNMRAKHQFAENSWEPKNFYVDQLVYVNKQITSLIRKIRVANPRANIILQSDHGPWLSGSSPDQVFEARSGILYAWYSADNIPIPSATSPVNTFRYFLNELFGCHLQVLRDSSAGKADLYNDPILKKKVN